MVENFDLIEQPSITSSSSLSSFVYDSIRDSGGYLSSCQFSGSSQLKDFPTVELTGGKNNVAIQSDSAGAASLQGRDVDSLRDLFRSGNGNRSSSLSDTAHWEADLSDLCLDSLFASSLPDIEISEGKANNKMISADVSDKDEKENSDTKSDTIPRPPVKFFNVTSAESLSSNNTKAAKERVKDEVKDEKEVTDTNSDGIPRPPGKFFTVKPADLPSKAFTTPARGPVRPWPDTKNELSESEKALFERVKTWLRSDKSGSKLPSESVPKPDSSK